MGGPDIDHTQGLTVPRRSLYFRHADDKQMELLKIFDGASPLECYQRTESIVPQQALAMMNSDLTRNQARLIAQALAAKVGADPAIFTRTAFERVLCRPPTADEAMVCIKFLGSKAEERLREDLLHSLLNHYEFRTARYRGTSRSLFQVLFLDGGSAICCDVRATSHPSECERFRASMPWPPRPSRRLSFVGYVMTSTWNELASRQRWRSIVSFIRNWVGPFDAGQGMSMGDLDAKLRTKGLNLPVAVREWYLLGGNWNHPEAPTVWIRPEHLEAWDGVFCILTDDPGVTHWGVRITDFSMEDPPVVSVGKNDEVISPTFSDFVATVIVNDVIFDYETEAPVELNRESTWANHVRLVSQFCGGVYADRNLESATIVVFVYPGGGPVFGKSRTPAGRTLLESLQTGPPPNVKELT